MGKTPHEDRWARCTHGYCSDCKTRRGRNTGNRKVRHAVRAALRSVRRDGS